MRKQATRPTGKHSAELQGACIIAAAEIICSTEVSAQEKPHSNPSIGKVAAEILRRFDDELNSPRGRSKPQAMPR
jgi:hypothetical protein